MRVATSEISFPKMEEDILSFWEKDRTFYKSNDQRDKAKRFSFYDGPPFANGLPHYGHLLANTIKDIVPRYWNMRGHFVERRFGWDCHGLPVEFEIEKKHGLKGRQDILKMGVAEFNKLCEESVFHYTGEWQKTITRLGRWVDWNNQYRTMDLSFMESVWWVFSELYKKNLVYRGHKVVPYSPRITAVLSNFEANQNYKDVQDPALTVKFKVKGENAFLLAWTTTPWTLVSNLALVVGPEIDYVKVKDVDSGEIYYLAEARLDHVYKGSAKKQEKPYEVLEKLSAADLAGKKYEPLFPYFKSQTNAFQILTAEFVTVNDGTGIVHAAPAYGEDDYFVCQKADISIVDPLDEEANFTDQVPELKGLFVKDADKEIIQTLKKSGALLRHETLVHSYPFCERTDTPLIYRAIPAWYVAVEQFKDSLVANNQKIHWVPEHLKNGRMGKWLENARDWAISRNRFWGTPIPVWICDKNDEHRVSIDSIATLEKLTGAKVTNLHKQYIDPLTIECPTCQSKMHRISEVFDCWFESGSMPYSQLHYPFENKDKFEQAFPADFIAEGLDQTRGWFYTLAILSTAIFNKPAFKNVVVNGLVLAEDGRKMSKRWQNYTPPGELMNEFGADAVRLYMLNSAILRGEDLRFSNQGVRDTTRAVLLPLWNAYSFLSTYADADGWRPSLNLAKGEVPKVKGEMDRWLISRFQSLVASVHKEMEQYRLYNVVPVVLGFIEDLTNWYIRLSRRRFWGGAGKISDDSREAYETLYFTLLNFTKVLAPFAPFVAEEIYQGLTEGEKGVANSVHLTDMPVASEAHIDRPLEERMSLIRRVTELGRSLRAKHQIKTRQVLPGIMIITRHPEDKRYIDESKELIASELNVKEISFSADESNFVNLGLKPNLRSLGKRLGSRLKEVTQHFEGLKGSSEAIDKLLLELEQSGRYHFSDIELTEEDILIDRQPKDDRLIATDRGVTVLLDTTLTDELIKEGLAREVINRVQKLRKDSNLQITDRIKLELAASGELKEAITTHGSYISSEVLAKELVILDGVKVGQAQHHQAFEINDATLTVGISVVG